MSYARRRIDLKFQLGKGNFGDSGFDTVDLTGLRVSAHISKAGGVSLSSLDMRVYGMSLSTMNQLSTLGKPLVDGRNNTVTLSAGDDESGMAVVFTGTIQQAWSDMTNAPEGSLTVSAFSGILDALKPLPPSSFKGQADASVIVAGLASQMGYNFENGGVTVQLANPYYPGTGRQQLESVARAGPFNFFIDDTTNTLAIWPIGGVRGAQVPLISPETGLIGYPAHTDQGISLTTLYNRAITFGANVQVQSSLTPACGLWTVFKVDHSLESETPGGKWFTSCECNLPGQVSVAR